MLTCRVGIALPTVEVRFDHLTIEAECYIGDRALPTLPNAARNMAESSLSCLGIRLAERAKITILKDASGIIKPSRYVYIGQFCYLRPKILLVCLIPKLQIFVIHVEALSRYKHQ